MFTKDPKIAGPGDRLVRWGGHVIRIGQALLHTRVKQFGQFILAETDQLQVEIHARKFGQFDRQQLKVPGGQLR